MLKCTCDFGASFDTHSDLKTWVKVCGDESQKPDWVVLSLFHMCSHLIDEKKWEKAKGLILIWKT